MTHKQIILTMAVAGLLVAAAAKNSFAQDPMGRGNAAPSFFIGADEASPGGAMPPADDLESSELSPFTQTQSSVPPPSQDESGTSEQNSPSGAARKLNVNPVTGMVSAAESTYIPLTGDERWKLYWKMNYFSMGAYFGPFFNALLLDQATGSPAQWGGGFAGYGRRLASRTASAILQGTFQAPAAYLLHEDVRYIESKRRGFKHRALHAIAYSFLVYNNSGRPTLNVANLGAYYASTAVSTAWLPGRYKVLDYTLSNSTEQIGLTLPVNLLQEFWPDVMGRLHRRRGHGEP